MYTFNRVSFSGNVTILEMGPVCACFQVIFKIVEDQDEKVTSQLHKEMRLIENVT